MSAVPMTADDLRARNRRLLGILLAIVGALVLGAFAIGIRW
ncbi:MAG TPA: hypothetical protein VGL09_19925 [Methylomirabilota bacterium]|jgi:hypothetical protein